ncbi:MAG: 16S rRNA (cytosine(1402)-N(4))-methyltransferase RsmH [Bacteroidota bacterium]|nr:16S rRNA (cytosine(1402)-N(4))-methyltransferase RsmH [Bacteroidota bacterium]
MSDSSYHIPVMLNETLEHLVTTTNGIYVDGTLGGGGHAEKICERLHTDGKLIGIDADTDAIQEARKRLQRFQSKIELVNENTAHIANILRSRNISTINGLLLDLGVSSFQLDEASKGFSFRGNERLDMRMDRRQSLDAHIVVNSYSEEELADVIFHYGEERLSRRIARRIVNQRAVAVIQTTGELASIVESVVGGKFKMKSLARVFQAIRIEVNDELHRLRTILNDSLQFIASGGRIVVISYHSLEDRIVKIFFNECAAKFIPSGNKFQPDTPRIPELMVITKKPLEATEVEQHNNPRSRSAKMRVAERT